MGDGGVSYREDGGDGLDGKRLGAVGAHGVLIVTGDVFRDVCEKLGEECHFEKLVVGKQVQSRDGGGLQTRGKRPVRKCTSSLLLDGDQLGGAGIGESIRRGVDEKRSRSCNGRKGIDASKGDTHCRDNRQAHCDDCVRVWESCEMEDLDV